MAGQDNQVAGVIDGLESQLDEQTRNLIQQTLETFAKSKSFLELSKDDQVRALSNRRMALVFAYSSPKNISDALLKAQAAQPELASKFRDSINGVVRDLLKDASTRGINLEEKNASEAMQRWYNHRDGLIGKYIDSATSVQQTVVGMAGLVAGLGAILGMFPGYEEAGKSMMKNAIDLQKEMTAQIAAQMETVKKMQTDNLPNKDLLDGIRTTNVSFRGSVTADQGPMNDLFGQIPRRYSPHEINQAAIQYLKKQAQISGESFSGDFLSSPLSSPGSGAPRVAGGHYGPVSVLSEATRDQVFAAMIMQESNGNPNAVSSAGARGLGQIMPGTAPAAAKLAGIAWDPKKYDADPQYQLRLSRAWFDHLADKYDGNMVLTLAAYNSGEGAVNDFMNGTNLSKNTRGGPTNPAKKRLGDPRKNETTDAAFAENYPYAETRIYVGKIAGNVARGIGYDVAAANADAAIKNAQATSKARVAAVKHDPAAAATKVAYNTAAAPDAPKTAKGDIKGLRQTAAALSLDGEAGSFADGAKPQQTVRQPLPALNYDRVT